MTKKILSMLLALCLLVGAIPMFASANSNAGLWDFGQFGYENDLTWTLMTDGNLIISSEYLDDGHKEVSMPNFGHGVPPWTKNKAYIRSVIIGNNILGIGSNTFVDYKKLESIYFPKTIQTVGEAAFAGCTNLKTIHYEGSENEYNLNLRPLLEIDHKDIMESVTVHFNCDQLDVAPSDLIEFPDIQFTDVPAGQYYTEPVEWAVVRGITKGKGSATTFKPGDNCTRAEIVTFLWRAMGEIIADTSANFTDMPGTADFVKAINWAVENGVTKGKGSNTFKPNDTCTRAEAVTFIWRAMGKPQANVVPSFTDMPSNSDFVNAISWAVENGVTKGKGGNTFKPNDICSRGEIVTFLYRAMTY